MVPLPVPPDTWDEDEAFAYEELEEEEDGSLSAVLVAGSSLYQPGSCEHAVYVSLVKVLSTLMYSLALVSIYCILYVSANSRARS